MDDLWTTADGKTLRMAEMETSHIHNCIKMLERNMPDDEADDYLTADHWSLTGVVVIPGAESYREKITLFKKELERRSKQELERGSKCTA